MMKGEIQEINVFTANLGRNIVGSKLPKVCNSGKSIQAKDTGTHAE